MAAIVVAIIVATATGVWAEIRFGGRAGIATRWALHLRPLRGAAAGHLLQPRPGPDLTPTSGLESGSGYLALALAVADRLVRGLAIVGPGTPGRRLGDLLHAGRQHGLSGLSDGGCPAGLRPAVGGRDLRRPGLRAGPPRGGVLGRRRVRRARGRDPAGSEWWRSSCATRRSTPRRWRWSRPTRWRRMCWWTRRGSPSLPCSRSASSRSARRWPRRPRRARARFRRPWTPRSRRRWR